MRPAFLALTNAKARAGKATEAERALIDALSKRYASSPDADGAALAAGVSPGDVILRVNNSDIANVKAFNEAVAKLDPKKPVALLIRDENGTRFVTFRPEGE